MKTKSKKTECYENYPFWTVFISNLFQILIYFIGAFILSKLGLIWLFIYLIYIIILEIRLLKKSCINCYYYGKYCAFGKGKLAGLFFKKGDNKKFIQGKITWKDIIPDFLVSVVPIILGVILLIIDFNWLILIFAILLILLMSIGNLFVEHPSHANIASKERLGARPRNYLIRGRKNETPQS